MNAIATDSAFLGYFKIRLIKINSIVRADADARAAIVAQLWIVGYFFDK